MAKTLLLIWAFGGFPARAQFLTMREMERVAIEALEAIQLVSIAEEREYCGYIIWQDLQMSATKATPGEFGNCLLPDPPEGAEIVASYHTHGNYHPDYDSEVPSLEDVQGDFEDEVYGFVGTPGGRVWLIDPVQEEIFAICEEPCLTQDIEYKLAPEEIIPLRFTQESLAEFLDEIPDSALIIE